jgi:hypothetical protein
MPRELTENVYFSQVSKILYRRVRVYVLRLTVPLLTRHITAGPGLS